LATWRVARYESSFIERQRLGDCSITLIDMPIDLGESLSVPVYDLEAGF